MSARSLLSPLFQTCLTVSVYATVAIAVIGCLIVHPVGDRDACGEGGFCAPLGACHAWAKAKGVSVAGTC